MHFCRCRPERPCLPLRIVAFRISRGDLGKMISNAGFSRIDQKEARVSSTLVRLGGIAAFVLGTSIGLAPLGSAEVNSATPPLVRTADDKCDKPGECPAPPLLPCNFEECPPPCVENCPPEEVAPPPAPPAAVPPAVPPAAVPPAQPPAAVPPAQSPAQRPSARPTSARPQVVPTAKPTVPPTPQVVQKPVGAVPAGGGATAQDDSGVSGPLLAAGGAAVVVLAAGGAYAHRRRRAESQR